jgi:cellulose biosynthesis protein BcsQ
MAPIISLFNHKGGVSKTTTAFNLGWAMADRGKKVLIVDGDPQCNLTGTVLGFDGISDFSAFYKKYPEANISSCLEPIFKATGTALKPAMITKTSHDNLKLGNCSPPFFRAGLLSARRAILTKDCRADSSFG